jgi:acetyl esterase
MTDTYWERLLAGYTEMGSAGPEHPDLRAGDPALLARLMAPSPEEAHYAAPDVATRDVTVTHATGAFPVRVYTPHGAPKAHRPLFVWAHGGAWAAGGLEGGESDDTAREVCARADCVVVSVDYRLATHGVHYPVPLDDVVAAFLWSVEHADELGVDPAAATLGGASAGANLAAGAALRLRDEGLATPTRLALVYAALHPVMPGSSGELSGKVVLLSPAVAGAPHLYKVIVENYLGAGDDSADGYAMPGVATDLSGVPPTLMIDCEYDGLRASAETFADQLRAAGVGVRQRVEPDVLHGHLARPGLPAAARTHRDLAAWVSSRSLP